MWPGRVTASHWTIGQLAIIYLLTFVVGVGRFAHCIASSCEILSAVMGGAVSTWGYFHWLIPATLGNICGGVFGCQLAELCTGEGDLIRGDAPFARESGINGFSRRSILNVAPCSAMASYSMSLEMQMAWLLMLAIPVACVAWTVTHEEVFREPREYCQRQTRRARTLSRRKFFYLFTCEYCFSHYVAAVFVLVTRFQMLYSGWRGYVISLFALVWVANQYMSIYNRLRLDIKHEHLEIQAKQEDVEQQKAA